MFWVADHKSRQHHKTSNSRPYFIVALFTCLCVTYKLHSMIDSDFAIRSFALTVFFIYQGNLHLVSNSSKQILFHAYSFIQYDLRIGVQNCRQGFLCEVLLDKLFLSHKGFPFLSLLLLFKVDLILLTRTLINQTLNLAPWIEFIWGCIRFKFCKIRSDVHIKLSSLVTAVDHWFSNKLSLGPFGIRKLRCCLLRHLRRLQRLIFSPGEQHSSYYFVSLKFPSALPIDRSEDYWELVLQILGNSLKQCRYIYLI